MPSVTKQPIPAPTAVPQNKQLVGDIVTHVADVMDFAVAGQYNQTRATLESYPEDVLRSLTDRIKNNTLPKTVTEIIGNYVHHKYVTEALHYFPKLPISIESPYFGITLVRSVRNYEQLPVMEDYSEADPDTQRKVTAIMTATAIFDAAKRERKTRTSGSKDYLPVEYRKSDTGFFDSIRITNDAMVDYLMQHPESAEQLATIVHERRTTDMDFITSIIENKAQALAEGTL